jgi:dihydroorotase
LKPGCQADVTLFDPNKEWTVDSRDFTSKGKNNPFDGCHFKGKVIITVVSGKIVYKNSL